MTKFTKVTIAAAAIAATGFVTAPATASASSGAICSKDSHGSFVEKCALDFIEKCEKDGGKAYNIPISDPGTIGIGCRRTS